MGKWSLCLEESYSTVYNCTLVASNSIWEHLVIGKLDPSPHLCSTSLALPKQTTLIWHCKEQQKKRKEKRENSYWRNRYCVEEEDLKVSHQSLGHYISASYLIKNLLNLSQFDLFVVYLSRILSPIQDPCMSHPATIKDLKIHSSKVSSSLVRNPFAIWLLVLLWQSLWALAMAKVLRN